MSRLSSKRPHFNNERSSSSAMISSSLYCGYPGCVKPSHQDGRGAGAEGMQQRQFCGLLHRDLFFSDLAHGRISASERPTGSWRVAAARDIGPGSNIANLKCMLQTCTKDAWRDTVTGQSSEFCGRSHLLVMVASLTKIWSSEGRLCNLKDCVRHVYVKDDGTCHDFCSIKHATLAAARKGLEVTLEALAAPLNSQIVEDRGIERLAGHFTLTSTDTNGINDEQRSQEKTSDNVMPGMIVKVSDSKLQQLLNGGHDGEIEGSIIQRGVDIYNFHPWDLVSSYQPRYFIGVVNEQRQRKGRMARTTKEGFTWKQSGGINVSENEILATRYFEYQLTNGEKKNGKKSEDLPLYVTVYKEFHSRSQNVTAGKNERQKNMQSSERSKCRWMMHEIMLNSSPTTESPMTVIWMIFQVEQGDPVWPPLQIPRPIINSSADNFLPSESGGPGIENGNNGGMTESDEIRNFLNLLESEESGMENGDSVRMIASYNLSDTDDSVMPPTLTDEPSVHNVHMETITTPTDDSFCLDTPNLWSPSY